MYDYKNLKWLWGAEWKFRHEGNCSALLCKQSNEVQLPEWRNFQFAWKNHYGFFFLHTLPSTIAFRLEYVLFYQFYTKITTFFDQAKFGTAPLLYVDIDMWRKLMWKWRQHVKNDVKTIILISCTRVVLHPSCKTTFPSPSWIHGNPSRVCKKSFASI